MGNRWVMLLLLVVVVVAEVAAVSGLFWVVVYSVHRRTRSRWTFCGSVMGAAAEDVACNSQMARLQVVVVVVVALWSFLEDGARTS